MLWFLDGRLVRMALVSSALLGSIQDLMRRRGSLTYRAAVMAPFRMVTLVLIDLYNKTRRR